jgi:adenine-specific DNA-methyltransferase
METHKPYFDIAEERIDAAKNGSLIYREIDQPVFDPRNAGAVARDPRIA